MVINRLPAEYQEVEYLENTNLQWIDTGILPNWHLSFHCKFMVYSNEAPGYGNVFGSRINSGSREYQLSAFHGGHVCVGTRNKVNGIPINAINVVDFDGEHTVIVNGQEKEIVTSEAMNTDTIVLFRIRQLHSTVQYQSGRIYELSFGNVRNFIPCYRKSDQEPGMYDTVSQTFFTNSGTGTFLVGNDVHHSNVNLMESRRRILLNTPHIKSLSGNALSFKTDVPFEMKECKIHFTPKQEGTGTPSPDNVRPITGWDGVTVTACGKNFFDESYASDINNYPSIGSGGYYYTAPIQLIPNTTYKATIFPYGTISKSFYFVIKSFTGDSYGWKDPGTLMYLKNGNYFRNYSAFTTGPTGIIRFAIQGSSDEGREENLDLLFSAANIQIELGSVATDYEPYTAQTLTIPFPRTIYGGYVDLVKGEVVEELACVDMGNLSWGEDSKASLFYANLPNSVVYYTGITYNIASNMYQYDKVWTLAQIRNRCMDGQIRTSSGTSRIYIYDESIETATDFKDAVVGRVISYPLATPSVISLTDPPSIPSTLRGLNNIISNANEISISFWSH